MAAVKPKARPEWVGPFFNPQANNRKGGWQAINNVGFMAIHHTADLTISNATKAKTWFANLKKKSK